MSNSFLGRFLASILASLIAGSALITYGQRGAVSDEDEADILEAWSKSKANLWRGSLATSEGSHPKTWVRFRRGD
jgi:hypothetical protein